MKYFAGLDWGESHHDLAVVDDHGQLVTHTRLPDNHEGLAQLLATLTTVRRNRRSIPIGIETGRGLMVAGLLKAGQPVVVLNPTQVANYRSRLAAQKKKSDRGDARLLAHVLRVDGDAHRSTPAVSTNAAALRELTRAHRQALHSSGLLARRLRSVLRDYYPSAATAWAHLPAGLTRPEARIVLAAAPTPTRAARLTRRRLETLLTAAGRTRLIGTEAARLHELFHTPALRQPAGIEAAMGHRAAALLTQLDATITSAQNLWVEVEVLADQHPQTEIYRSFPGMGPLLAARLLAELGDDPRRFPTSRNLRAFCAATPITWASGTSRRVSHRRKTNPILAETGHLWAFAALTRSPGARALYDRRRAAGDRHPAALRRLYAHFLGSLHYCLRHHVHYRDELAFARSTTPGMAENGT
ncbi:IS110 family transposase [Micromonospora sp. WMMD980]|uniref:IS110 family transposase n=1 Tax=Micromonospora sp. WMMD980 TaxID=3016088 RepID=UPI00241701E2|nr:IS110 family transposase [Micromonospora sp. WMMD980]MDG4803613.1 IS110 family transposase [Micromonospora sp. WMMD980]